MLPVCLYFLNLPSAALSSTIGAVDLNKYSESGAEDKESKGDLGEIGFLELEQAGLTEQNRNYYSGYTITVKGEYVPFSDKSFTLSRIKMNCCYADAFPLKAVILIDGSKMPDRKAPLLPGNEMRKKWVQVKGRLTFLQNKENNTYMTAIILSPQSKEHWKEMFVGVPQDPNPYAN
jgi:hypothetical protein